MHITERLFIKKRLVLSINRESYVHKTLDNPLYAVMKMNESTSRNCRDFLLRYISEEKLRERLQNPNCTGFIALENTTSTPVGFYWSIESRNKVVWHDKFPVPLNCALVFNAYVDIEHRRRRVYSLLLQTIHAYLFSVRDCTRVFTIVEASNIPSLIANTSFGLEVAAINYLVKLLGKNAISVYTDEQGTKVYYVFSGKKSISF